MRKRALAGVVVIIAACSLGFVPSERATQQYTIDPGANLKDFQVYEFRRYTIKPGERQHFALDFDTFFPEAFEQQGADCGRFVPGEAKAERLHVDSRISYA